MRGKLSALPSCRESGNQSGTLLKGSEWQGLRSAEVVRANVGRESGTTRQPGETGNFSEE